MHVVLSSERPIGICLSLHTVKFPHIEYMYMCQFLYHHVQAMIYGVIIMIKCRSIITLAPIVSAYICLRGWGGGGGAISYFSNYATIVFLKERY